MLNNVKCWARFCAECDMAEILCVLWTQKRNNSVNVNIERCLRWDGSRNNLENLDREIPTWDGSRNDSSFLKTITLRGLAPILLKTICRTSCSFAPTAPYPSLKTIWLRTLRGAGAYPFKDNSRTSCSFAPSAPYPFLKTKNLLKVKFQNFFSIG